MTGGLPAFAEATVGEGPCAIGPGCGDANVELTIRTAAASTKNLGAITAQVYRVTPSRRRNSDPARGHVPPPRGRSRDLSSEGTPAPVQLGLRPSPGSTARF